MFQSQDFIQQFPHARISKIHEKDFIYHLESNKVDKILHIGEKDIILVKIDGRYVPTKIVNGKQYFVKDLTHNPQYHATLGSYLKNTTSIDFHYVLSVLGVDALSHALISIGFSVLHYSSLFTVENNPYVKNNSFIHVIKQSS